MKRRKRWSFLNWLACGYAVRRFRLKAEPCAVEGPCLIIANHVTNWDPILLAASFPDMPIRFVASEHIFRRGWLSRVLEWFVAPIPRKKAASGADTVMSVLRALKDGDSVCIFAEGDACWDGLTHPVFPATGKLARMSGVTLVTYRLEGGYLSLPRWSKKLRRGKVHGAAVGVYSPGELKKMKGPEITALIDRDIFEDAWARQRKEHTPYRGKNRAEGIEQGFFLCPECGRIGTVRGLGDHALCDCGLDLFYNAEGFFEPAEPVETLADWEKIQSEALRELCGSTQGVIFSDDEMTLRRIDGEHGETILCTGMLLQTHDALEIMGRRFELAEIDSMAMVKANILLFSVGDSYYEIRAASACCLRKYLLVWQNARA